MKRFIMSIPTGVLSITVTIFVTYLSLASDPLNVSSMHLFPGADKLMHMIMYFGCTLVYLYEFQKSKLPHHPNLSIAWAFTASSALYGLLMECAQLFLTSSRSFDIIDWAADSVGAVLALVFMHFVGFHFMRVHLTATHNLRYNRYRRYNYRCQ